MPATLVHSNHGSLEPYDCTGKIGRLYPLERDAEWPMYSFDRPSMIVWNAIAANLNTRGWSDKRISEWLASKNTRWALDGSLGDQLAELADKWATEHVGTSERA